MSTIGALRKQVRPRGLIIIEDGFLASPSEEAKAHYPGYTDREESLTRLTAFGDALVAEKVAGLEKKRAVNRKNTDLIRLRAEAAKKRWPDLKAAIDQYLAREETETILLGQTLIWATWVLRRR